MTGCQSSANRCRLAVTGPEPRLVLHRVDVAPFRPVFTWHPSEATALLVAAARGLRGRVEIRDAGLGVTEHRRRFAWARDHSRGMAGARLSCRDARRDDRALVRGA